MSEPTFRRALPVLLSLAAVTFVSGTAEYVVAGLLPDISSDLDISISAAGQLITVYALSVAIGGPLVTLLTARLPRKGLMLGLVALFVLGAVVTASATGFGQAVAGRVLSGVAHAPIFAVALTVGAPQAPAARAGSAIAVISSGLTVATILGAPLGTLLGQAGGWRAAFVAIAAAGTVSLLPLALLMPTAPGSAGSPLRQARVLANRRVWTILSVTVLAQAGVGCVFAYLAPLSTQAAGFSAAAIPALLVLWGVGGFAGNLAAGRATDAGPVRVLLPTLGVMLAALTVLPWATAWAPAMIAEVLLLGGLMAGIIAPLQALVLGNTGGSGFAVAVNVSAFMAGHAVAGSVGGGVLAVTSAHGVAVAAAVLTAAALATVWLGLARRGAEPEVKAVHAGT